MLRTGSQPLVNSCKHRFTPRVIAPSVFRNPHSGSLSLSTPIRIMEIDGRRPMTTATGGRVKTFSNQAKLPRLPVPDLEKSLEGYVKSLIPVLEQKYGPADLPKEIEKRKLFARDFAAKDGLGHVLQERLKDLDHVSPNNWLNDTLWLGLAYHTWRAPLVVNSNYWLLFAPDPSDPTPPTYSADSSKTSLIPQPEHYPKTEATKGSQKGGEEWLKANELPKKPHAWEDLVSKENISDWQVKKAAWMVRRYAEYRTMVAREELPPDTSKAGPFCMHQYSRLFNFSRIPLPGSDAFSAIAPQATHITVMIEDFIYSVDVFATAGEDGIPEPLPVGVIQRNLQAVVEDVNKRKKAGEKATRIGILTADERDKWVVNREHLLLLSPENRQALKSISTSLISVCLDSYTVPSIPSSDPLINPPIDAQVRNGIAGLDGGRNRWLDKSTSIVIETNGRASLHGEHSPVDALIPGIVMDYVSAQPVGEIVSAEQEGGSGQGWSRVDWIVDEQITKEIEECEGRNRTIIADSDASQLWWGEYGVEWIKKNAKVSPDAFLQQALQLAWYRDQGYATATYETASTRTFLHGRTDVIRTLSVESRAFVKAMLDDKADDVKRYKLLTEACTTHSALTRQSSAGHGWDRHLMGLKVMLRDDETHQIFEDDMYAKSQEWKLSTSGLSSGTRFTGSGFGCAWPDGYGVNYLPGAYLIKFGVESKWSCGVTSTARFKHNIVQSLRDMRRVAEAAAPKGETIKAKL